MKVVVFHLDAVARSLGVYRYPHSSNHSKATTCKVSDHIGPLEPFRHASKLKAAGKLSIQYHSYWVTSIPACPLASLPPSPVISHATSRPLTTKKRRATYAAISCAGSNTSTTRESCTATSSRRTCCFPPRPMTRASNSPVLALLAAQLNATTL